MKNAVIFVQLFLIMSCVCFAQSNEICEDVVYSSKSPSLPLLVTDGQFFKDTAGRVVLLRGVNATGDAKLPPFKTLTDQRFLDPLPGWGINVIRFLFTWEAFEPIKCQYDESYLSYYEQAVQWAAERDIYVIVDFHQDAFSRYSIGGCGEGFPYWAVSSSVRSDTPLNDDHCANWGAMMILDLSHHLTWDYFYRDREGARTRYLAMLEKVAHRLSSHPNVIGYDIINEPWGNTNQISALFEDAAVALRKYHPNAILFVPPPALISGIGNNQMEKPSFDNFAYAPHYYDSGIWLTKIWFGSDPGNRLNDLRQKAVDWGVPMLLGEYGAAEETVNGARYVEGIYKWLDQTFVGGTQWCYTPGWTPEKKDGFNGENFSIVDDRGQLRSMFVPRPYPRKTAGIPVSFARERDDLRYSWNNDPALGDTEFFLPLGYEKGKVARVTRGNGTCSLSSQTMVCDISSTGLAEVKVSAL